MAIYEKLGATKIDYSLLNDTRANLASVMNPCKIGVEIDTARMGYKDNDGNYHSVPFLAESALTGSRALVSDSAGSLTVSAVTSTELDRLSGVTSAVQTQINSKVAANAAITGATKPKVTYDAKGLVTAGADLAATDIPNISTDKLTSGTLGVSRGGTGLSTLTSGSFLVGNGTSAATLRTPSQVLSDIAAFPLAHGISSGRLFRSTGATTVASSIIRDDGTNVGIGLTPVEKLDVGLNSAGFGGKKHFAEQITTTGAGVVNGKAIKLNNAHGTTPDALWRYKVQLTTNATGSPTGSTYLVAYNTSSELWEVRAVSQSGTGSNNPLLGIVAGQLVAYTNHASGYPIRCVVEAVYTNSSAAALHSMGADFHWQRIGNNLRYDDGNIGIGVSPTVALDVSGNAKVSGTISEGGSLLEAKYAPIAHNQSATTITTGTLAVARGGTGLASYTTGNYVRASGATTLEQRTPSQVLGDIGGVAANSAITGATLTKITYDAKGLVTAGATLAAGDIPNLDASKLASGTLGVVRGGTGHGELTSGLFLVGNGTGAVKLRTPAQVLVDIGAEELGHTHGTFTNLLIHDALRIGADVATGFNPTLKVRDSAEIATHGNNRADLRATAQTTGTGDAVIIARIINSSTSLQNYCELIAGGPTDLNNYFGLTGAAASHIRLKSMGGKTCAIGTVDEGAPLAFASSGTVLMRLTAQGLKVFGATTTNATEALDVTGNILASGSLIANSVRVDRIGASSVNETFAKSNGNHHATTYCESYTAAGVRLAYAQIIAGCADFNGTYYGVNRKNAAFLQLFSAGGNPCGIGTEANSDLVIGTNNVERMRILKSGGVTSLGEVNAPAFKNGTQPAFDYAEGTFTGTLSPSNETGGNDLKAVTCTWVRIGKLVMLHIPLCYTKDTTYSARYITNIPAAIRPATTKNVALIIFSSDAGYVTSGRFSSYVVAANSSQFRVHMTRTVDISTVYNHDFYGIENQVISYSLT